MRDQVVDAALKLLNELGLDALTSRRVAQKLGVESATLYWHFRDKSVLFGEDGGARAGAASHARRSRRADASARIHAQVDTSRIPTVSYSIRIRLGSEDVRSLRKSTARGARIAV